MSERYPPEAAPLAREAGREAAHNAASWIGPVESNSARALLSMLSNGDPAVWDYLPAAPNLSGEWADDPTPLSLARSITGVSEPGGDAIDALADAFELAVADTFERACERELLRWAA